MAYDVKTALSEIAPLIKAKKLIVLAGSGVSVASGLPTWDGLLHSFIEFFATIRETLDDKLTAAAKSEIDELLEDAKHSSAAHPLKVVTVLKNKLKEIQRDQSTNVDNLFKLHFTKLFINAVPNKNHELIVTTDYPYILTTNYDVLFEEAAKNKRLPRLYSRNYSFDEPDKVAAAIFDEKPSVLHLHGNILNIAATEDFVFTAEDYVRIKRRHHGFTLAIQSLFMRYSILYVGYGGSDPHLEEFAEELSHALGWPSYPTFPVRNFIVLLESKVSRGGRINQVIEKYQKITRTEIVALKDFSETTVLLEELQKLAPRTVDS